MKLAALLLAALALAAPAAASVSPASVLQGEESGDPCGGHASGETWEDPMTGHWMICLQYTGPYGDQYRYVVDLSG